LCISLSPAARTRPCDADTNAWRGNNIGSKAPGRTSCASGSDEPTAKGVVDGWSDRRDLKRPILNCPDWVFEKIAGKARVVLRGLADVVGNTLRRTLPHRRGDIARRSGNDCRIRSKASTLRDCARKPDRCFVPLPSEVEKRATEEACDSTSAAALVTTRLLLYPNTNTAKGESALRRVIGEHPGVGEGVLTYSLDANRAPTPQQLGYIKASALLLR